MKEMGPGKEEDTQESNGTDCQDWHKDPSPSVLARDDEEETDYFPVPEVLLINGDMESPNNDAQLDADDEHEDVQGSSSSVYAMSAYPKVQPAYQVEQPYENGVDGATIDSSRTLYAEDVDYVTHCGRQYVSNYFMPIDQEEQTRSYVMHQVYLKLLNLELTTVPLDNPKYILDVGTGIGEWAIGMAEKYSECDVFGTDIAPIQPTHQVPFNVEFNIENAEDEWIRPANTFDMVHFRTMAGAFENWPFIYQQTIECLRPGGWIEIMDFDDMYTSQSFISFYPPDSQGHRYFKALQEALLLASDRGAGGFGLLHHMDRDLLTETGFVDIQESVFQIGIGERENESYGKFWLFAVMTGFESVSMRLLTKYLGWDEAYVRELCHGVAQETKEIAEDYERPEGFSIGLKVLVGRKPDVDEDWMAKELNENASMKNTGSSSTGSGDDSTIGSMSISNRTITSDDTA